MVVNPVTPFRVGMGHVILRRLVLSPLTVSVASRAQSFRHSRLINKNPAKTKPCNLHPGGNNPANKNYMT